MCHAWLYPISTESLFDPHIFFHQRKRAFFWLDIIFAFVRQPFLLSNSTEEVKQKWVVLLVMDSVSLETAFVKIYMSKLAKVKVI